VHVAHGDGVAVVTLVDPARRNAMTATMVEQIVAVFDALETDGTTAAVVVTGAPPAFCSGMDTSQFGGDRANRERLVETSIRCFRAVGNCPKPVVAAVNGPALAGGFALALLCDLRLAAEEASFGFPELPRGIPPSYAAARAALPARVAAELTLTGRLLDAAGAERMGIVSAVYPADQLMPRAIELAGRIASGPRQAIAETKRRILLDRERTIGHLFEEEERLLREALLGDEPDDAA
jgi:enoyl-CoA hydratase/carnithine racemase